MIYINNNYIISIKILSYIIVPVFHYTTVRPILRTPTILHNLSGDDSVAAHERLQSEHVNFFILLFNRKTC